MDQHTQALVIAGINYGWNARGLRERQGEQSMVTNLGRELTNAGLDLKAFTPGGAQGLMPGSPTPSGGGRNRPRRKTTSKTAATTR